MFDAYRFRRWARRMAEILYGIGVVEYNTTVVLSKLRPGERRNIDALTVQALRREIAYELFIPKKVG